MPLVHPIVCDQQNLCEMVKADSLSKQKLGQLQFFCSEMELAVPVPPMRKKAHMWPCYKNTSRDVPAWIQGQASLTLHWGGPFESKWRGNVTSFNFHCNFVRFQLSLLHVFFTT